MPISLSGDQPAPARAFAWRQLQLMQARRKVLYWDQRSSYQPAPARAFAMRQL